MSSKSRRRNNIHLLDGEQKAALAKFAKDFQTASPHIAQAAGAARRIFDDTVHAPSWRVAEAEQPDGAQPPQQWSVGHAQVNFVDHIARSEGRHDDT